MQSTPGSSPNRAARSIVRTVRRAGLTDREHQVLCLVAHGDTATRIGHLLRIAPTTVRKHLEHVYTKLDAHDRLLAVQRAQALGLLEPVAGPDTR